MTASTLPPNATPLARVLEQVVARRFGWDVPVAAVLDPLACPPAVLPWLAYADSVDRWSPDWSEEARRASIAAAPQVHATKGTPAAVRASLGALGFATDLVEWFAPGGSGQPFTARVDCYADGVIGAGGAVDAALVALITGVVSVTAPARVHFTVRVGERLAPAPIALRAGIRERTVERVPIEPAARTHVAPVAIAVRVASRDRAVWRHTHDVLRAA